MSRTVLALALSMTACSESSSESSSQSSSAASAGESSASSSSSVSSEVSETDSEESFDSSNSDAGSETSEASDDSSDASDETSGGKTLVVYYSATGSTKAVAETIADRLGADLFEITPVDIYTDDDLNWTNDNSRVSVEHNDESKRDVPLTETTLKITSAFTISVPTTSYLGF